MLLSKRLSGRKSQMFGYESRESGREIIPGMHIWAQLGIYGGSRPITPPDPHLDALKMYGSLLLKPIHKGSPPERSSSTPPKPSGGFTPLSSSFSHKPRGGSPPSAAEIPKYLVPSTWYQVLGSKYLVQVPGTKYLVPSTLYRVLGTRYLVLSTWYQVLATKYLVPSTGYQVLGTKYLVPGTR